MTTTQELINKSAKLAGIRAEAQTLEAGINTDAIKSLNMMIARFRNNGIDLGLSTLSAADELYIDDADEEALYLQLSLRLMAEHKRPIDPGIALAGKDAVTELQAKYTKIPTMNINSVLTSTSYNINAG